MTKYIFSVFFLGFLLLGKQHLVAQNKNLEISEALAANSEKLKVKMGAQWFGKIWKFKFGDYAVTDSKNKYGPTTSNSNFFNTKVETKSNQKFSFVLRDKTTETAIVEVAFSIQTKELLAIELFSNFYLGPNLLLKDSQNFTAFISTSDNATDTWVLVLKMDQGSEIENKQEAFLTNGERLISIIPISSNDSGRDSRMFPALGYEFTENDQPLGAMQYYGGGALGFNKNIVWLPTHLEPRMKLILAAAMTSLLQKHADEMAID
ncbi:hypothetical protein ACKGJN_06175 [Gillisia sp. Q332]|uniref:hypothetical protein n=1 Tax=Gillisia xinjiangensis TaxID=3384765 RepID=UPI00391D0272